MVSPDPSRIEFRVLEVSRLQTCLSVILILTFTIVSVASATIAIYWTVMFREGIDLELFSGFSKDERSPKFVINSHTILMTLYLLVFMGGAKLSITFFNFAIKNENIPYGVTAAFKFLAVTCFGMSVYEVCARDVNITNYMLDQHFHSVIGYATVTFFIIYLLCRLVQTLAFVYKRAHPRTPDENQQSVFDDLVFFVAFENRFENLEFCVTFMAFVAFTTGVLYYWLIIFSEKLNEPLPQITIEESNIVRGLVMLLIFLFLLNYSTTVFYHYLVYDDNTIAPKLYRHQFSVVAEIVSRCEDKDIFCVKQQLRKINQFGAWDRRASRLPHA